MARYHGLPEGYRPALKVQLRKEPEGGDVRNPGAALPELSPAFSRREILVMVHGFNNHEGEAAKAYVGFRACQYANFPELVPGSLDKLLGDGFWPGDADWGWLDLGDFFVYPKAVSKAKKAAAALEALLGKFPNLERVSFIAHSLGCRVVLETVKNLLAHGGPSVGGICLMAAAVPVEMVVPGGRFADTLRKLQALGVPIRVLHSVDDNVLRFTFVPGQAGAGPSESTLLALGRKGPPRDMPGRGDNVSEQQIYGAGHSNYWGHEFNAAALQATQEAGNFFKFGSPRREIASRSIGSRSLT